MVKFAIVGNRVPHTYFLTTGHGESDAGSKHLPAETGSYDAALESAGIEDVNVVKYTSVMPTDAKEISKAKGIASIRWGEVMESIMAQSNGKKGTHIPLEARIVAVADVFDALTSDRPYKKAWSNDETFAMLKKMAGETLDRDCVNAIINSRKEVEEIQGQFKEDKFG